MKEIMLEDLKIALEKSWSADTAFNRKKWDPKNPAAQQCWVAAMVVQKFLGGEIKAVRLGDGDDHWWNVLPDGKEIDLTKNQFPKDFVCPPGKTVNGRAAFRNPWNYKRFKILEERVEKFLKNQGENK